MSIKNGKTAKDDLRPEYGFDYSKSKPNRFASDSKGAIPEPSTRLSEP